jgi:hypothetical protein
VESLTRPSANEKTSQSHDVPKRRVDKTGTDADTAGLVVPPKADPQFVGGCRENGGVRRG